MIVDLAGFWWSGLVTVLGQFLNGSMSIQPENVPSQFRFNGPISWTWPITAIQLNKSSYGPV